MGSDFTALDSLFNRPALALISALAVPILALTACTWTADDAPSSTSSDNLLAAAESDDSSNNAQSSASGTAPIIPQRLRAHIVERLPFDPTSFTQGLEVTESGQLLVGTGQYGQSRVYLTNPRTDDQSASVSLPPYLFGEGLTQADTNFGPVIWELTWKAGQAIKRDPHTLQETGRASYQGEGWGLCSLGGELIMSDGSSQLRYLDPSTFQETKARTTITLAGQEIDKINELECVNDASTTNQPTVYANVWMSTDILRINPTTGVVTGVIDASAATNNAADDQDNVLNGIAHIPGSDEFYITGKRWPDLYRVIFEPAR